MNMADLIPLGEVPSLLPVGIGGRRVSIETCRRWCIRGLRNGRKLESVRIGGRRYVHPEALARFCSDGDDHDKGRPVRLRGRDQRRRQARATKALQVAGIL